MPLVSALCVFAVGCMAPYQPPTAAEPHAIVKVRRSYALPLGATLTERVIIDDTLAFRLIRMAGLAREPRTDGLLVHPRISKVRVEATFSHQEMRMVPQTFSCGSYQSPRTCSRMMSQTVTVIDSHCRQEMGVRLEQGRTYLFELGSLDPNQCVLRCYLQNPGEGGTFRNERCQILSWE